MRARLLPHPDPRRLSILPGRTRRNAKRDILHFRRVAAEMENVPQKKDGGDCSPPSISQPCGCDYGNVTPVP
jgi:hypothetical protein